LESYILKHSLLHSFSFYAIYSTTEQVSRILSHTYSLLLLLQCLFHQFI